MGGGGGEGKVLYELVVMNLVARWLSGSGSPADRFDR